VTKLIQRMREELARRNFAESTMRTYLQVVEDSGATCRLGWTNADRMTFAATKCT
jgi:hypothetical protein